MTSKAAEARAADGSKPRRQGQQRNAAWRAHAQVRTGRADLTPLSRIGSPARGLPSAAPGGPSMLTLRSSARSEPRDDCGAAGWGARPSSGADGERGGASASGPCPAGDVSTADASAAIEA